MSRTHKEEEYKKIVQGAFDEASDGYDNPSMRFFDNSAEHLIKQLSLGGNEHIADIATGTGKVALLAAKRLPGGRVTAVDISEGMLSRAREKARLGGVSNISFLCQDVDKVDFPGHAFDGLLCSFGVHFWSDMQGSLKRLTRSIKPGGFVAMTSFASGSFDPQSTLLLNRFKQYGVKLPDHYTWERLDSQKKTRELLESVGLTAIRTEQSSMGYYLTSVSQWWDIVRFSGFRAFLNQLPAERVEHFKSENLGEIEKTANGKGIYLNVETIFSIAYK